MSIFCNLALNNEILLEDINDGKDFEKFLENNIDLQKLIISKLNLPNNESVKTYFGYTYKTSDIDMAITEPTSYEIENVEGDGNCLFNSVLRQISTDINILELRRLSILVFSICDFNFLLSSSY